MKTITNILIDFLSIIFPRLKKTIKEGMIEYEYKEIERNSTCYCKSGKKYKHCHLIINETHKEVALRQIDKNGKESIIVVDKKEVDGIKGIIATKIEVKNTFSEVDIAICANTEVSE